MNENIDKIPDSSVYKKNIERLKQDVEPKYKHNKKTIFSVFVYDNDEKRKIDFYMEYIDSDGNIRAYA